MEHFPWIKEIADKVLFGIHWPDPGVPGVRSNIDEFQTLPISKLAQRKILYDKAARLFPVQV